MADSFSDIMGDYENKSLEELGSSLLSRQQQINQDNAKEAKKSQRVAQALALIGVGQKVFKNAYNKRADELDKQELFLLSNNDSEAKEIAQLGRIMQYMPEKEWADKNKNLDIDSKVKLYLEEYDGDGLSVKFKPVIDGLIKQEIGEENFNAFKGNTDTYDTAYDTALNNVLKEYLKNDVDGNANYLSFEDELRKTLQLDKNMDRLDVFKRARGLKAYDLTQAEKRLVAERRSLYRNRGAMNIIKDGFSQIGLRNERNGGINVFKNIESTNLAGGNLSDILNNLDLGGIVIGSVDESMTEYRNTFESITDLARSDADLIARTKQNLTTFDKNIRKEKIYDSDNKYKMTITRKKWNNFADDIIEDELQLEEWATDIASLSLAFKNDIDFAERVYIGGLEKKNIQVNQTELDNFKNKIKKSEKYRLDIATAITAQQGFKKGGGIFSKNPEYYAEDTDEKIMETYQYNRNSGFTPALLGEGIIFKNNKYNTDSSWDNMDKKNKQRAFDFKVKEIFAATSVNNNDKIQMFERLFEDIENPYELNYEEYMQTLGPKIISTINNQKGIGRGLYNDDGNKKSLREIFF